MQNIKQEAICKFLGKVGKEYINTGDGYYQYFYESIGCLDFLNGKTGTVSSFLRPEWCDFFEKYLHAFNVKIDWPNAKVTFKNRTIKLGKWIRNVSKNGKLTKEIEGYGANFIINDIILNTNKFIKEIETRKELHFNYKITTCPQEILAMSWDKGWTSCARPGGAYGIGPISDMRAGSALILFYRPGTEQPCGREIIRPAVIVKTKQPVILRSEKLYGAGILIKNSDITTKIPVIKDTIAKAKYHAVKNGIYCDIYCGSAGYSDTEDNKNAEILSTAFSEFNTDTKKFPKAGVEFNKALIKDKLINNAKQKQKWKRGKKLKQKQDYKVWSNKKNQERSIELKRKALKQEFHKYFCKLYGDKNIQRYYYINKHNRLIRRNLNQLDTGIVYCKKGPNIHIFRNVDKKEKYEFNEKYIFTEISEIESLIRRIGFSKHHFRRYYYDENVIIFGDCIKIYCGKKLVDEIMENIVDVQKQAKDIPNIFLNFLNHPEDFLKDKYNARCRFCGAPATKNNTKNITYCGVGCKEGREYFSEVLFGIPKSEREKVKNAIKHKHSCDKPKDTAYSSPIFHYFTNISIDTYCPIGVTTIGI
jgi:hypothetical protein